MLEISDIKTDQCMHKTIIHDSAEYMVICIIQGTHLRNQYKSDIFLPLKAIQTASNSISFNVKIFKVIPKLSSNTYFN